MKGEQPANPQASRLPELDGLRATAILLVLGFHYLSCVPIWAVRSLSSRGWVGVDLFFVLSGFLIGGILVDQRAAVNYYRVFYLRRFFRIVPLYAVLVLPGLLVVTFGLQSYFRGHSLAQEPMMGLWFCAFFIQNCVWLFHSDLPNYLVPTWSVAVEEQFYLLLPPLVRNLRPKRLLAILILAIVFAPLLRGILFWQLGETAARSCYALLPCRWDALLLGVLCAFGYRDARFRDWIAGQMRWLQLVWWLSTLGSMAMLGRWDRLDPHMGFLGYTLIDIWFASTLFLAVANPAGQLRRFFSRPFFKPIATISYGVYLLHSPMRAIADSVLHFAHIGYDNISWKSTGVAGACLIGTMLAAAASWKILESPMLRLGHKHRFQQPGE